MSSEELTSTLTSADPVIGATPLVFAAVLPVADSVAVGEILIGGGADVNGGEEFPGAPLFMAAQEGNAPYLQLLLRHGAEPSRCTTAGATSLVVASQNNHLECVATLISAGATVDASAMSVAIQNGNEAVSWAEEFEGRRLIGVLVWCQGLCPTPFTSPLRSSRRWLRRKATSPRHSLVPSRPSGRRVS